MSSSIFGAADTLASASASQIAAAVGRREIGCLELADAQIARIERLDPALNAVVVRDFDRARDLARRLDQDAAAAGPLRGVPMTVKESFDVAGLPTTWGLAERRLHRAAEDATAVRRLRAAGAVILGKTNVPTALADWQTDNPLYGRTVNPWNPARTPGGSSGGAAAALAAGLCALELGSDLFGSIRVPAHCCGVFGHRPTWDLVPARGHGLSPDAAPADMSVPGPMARSAHDLARALAVLAGPESGAVLTLPPARIAALRGARIALWAEQPRQATDAATTALLLELAAFLAQEGAEISYTARPEFDPDAAIAVFLQLLAGMFAGSQSPAERARLSQAAAALSPDAPGVDAALLRYANPAHGEWLGANDRRDQIRRAWNRFFEQWDVLLCPAFATAALPHQTEAPATRTVAIEGREWACNDLMFWVAITAGFQLPSTVAPLGLAPDGLPIGVQIVGPTHGDWTTIKLAQLLEAAWRGFVPPPGY